MRIFAEGRAPRGFKNFYPKKGGGGKDGAAKASKKPKEASSGSSSSTKKGAGSAAGSEAGAAKESTESGLKDMFGAFGGRNAGGSGGGGGAGGKPGGPQPQEDVQRLIYLAALLGALFFFSGMGGGSNGMSGSGREISWQDFKTQLIGTGLVDRLVVVNKNTVRVIMRRCVVASSVPFDLVCFGALPSIYQSISLSVYRSMVYGLSLPLTLFVL